MRRGGTVLVMVVVAAIALAAGFDALRGESEAEPTAQSDPEPPAVSTTTAPEAPAPEAAIGGVLYYTDEGCTLKAVRLPGPAPTDAPNWHECRFVLSPDGERVAPGGFGWDPHSDPRRGRFFESDGQTIQVLTNAGPEGESFAGTAPAWRPDGTLTFFADGSVRAWPEGNVVLSQRFLRGALQRSPDPTLRDRFQRFRMREALWLDETRLAAILSAEGEGQSQDLLAVYDGRRLVEGWLDRPGGFSDLRASPSGRYVATKESGQRGLGELLLVEPGRGEVLSAGIAGYRAIAWSPDEQFVAAAADNGVFVYRPGVPGPPALQLDLAAQDLAWRSEADPPPLTGADEISGWLAGLRTSGRLLVTERDEGTCRLRVLRLPDLAGGPGVQQPCRFSVDDEGLVRGEVDTTCQGVDACEAVTPEGTPTFVRGGELFAGTPGGRSELLVSAADLQTTFGRASALEEVAWVDEMRFWAVVRSGGSAIVALMTPDELVSAPSFTTETIENLRVSSTGMVAASTARGIVFFDSGGRRAMTFANGRDVSWAPGQLVAAVSTPREVLFVAPVSGEVATLSLTVEDLEWVVP